MTMSSDTDIIDWEIMDFNSPPVLNSLYSRTETKNNTKTGWIRGSVKWFIDIKIALQRSRTASEINSFF